MDPLGNVVRGFLKAAHASNVRNATNLALEFLKEGMRNDQIEEMLYAGDFEQDVIAAAMASLPDKKKKG